MEKAERFLDCRYTSDVCKLDKALYVSKPALKALFHKLSKALIRFEMPNLILVVYLLKSKSYCHATGVCRWHLGTGSCAKLIAQAISNLNKKFALKELGSEGHFLGIEASKDTTGGLHLSQIKYIQDLLVRTDLDQSKTCPTPMVMGRKFVKTEGKHLRDRNMYRSIGSFQ